MISILIQMTALVTGLACAIGCPGQEQRSGLVAIAIVIAAALRAEGFVHNSGVSRHAGGMTVC